MEGRIEKLKEISPMYPRLHVKDAEKVGPKGPPRNKMALHIEEVKDISPVFPRLYVKDAEKVGPKGPPRNKMALNIEEVKDISPVFPRLYVKDAEKVGPKGPPRNKMAFDEKLTIPSYGRNFFWGKRDGHKSEDTYRHYDAPSKNIPDYEVGMKITPEDVMRVAGEKQYWKARSVIIK
ncbi:hypothetical protein QN277_022460 [Acacia crassicarpa]|uniref:Uncharacterized protein n=1 Tax=Acacia crassicarpa TaxID=499986 RepID=A0AAE1JJP9_9FABA|nr:hypothetical protein QN277_022460 [Acacia crassicarpa]